MDSIRSHKPSKTNTLTFLGFTSILNWENPTITILFLVVLNLAFIIWSTFNMGIISSGAYKLFVFSLFYLAKNQIFGEVNECEWFNKENIEKTYVSVYDNINKFMDKLRKMILLHEIPSLVRLLVGLLFIITFGSHFSTFSLLLILFDLYTISRFGTVREKFREYSNVAIELTTKIISDNIPKYKEK